MLERLTAHVPNDMIDTLLIALLENCQELLQSSMLGPLPRVRVGRLKAGLKVNGNQHGSTASSQTIPRDIDDESQGLHFERPGWHSAVGS